MKFSIYQESRTGARSNNEDRITYLYSRDALLMVLADGMGGHLNGEVAAQVMVQSLSEAFRREALARLADPLQFLRKSVTEAHNAIVRHAAAEALAEIPCTTCVACAVQDGKAYWAHLGDSRLYLLRDGRVQTRTKDHSLVQMLVDAGRIREEAMSNHPARNKVFNCIGGRNLPEIDLSQPIPLHAGDTLLLCTDGVWGPLSASIITQTLLTSDTVKGASRLLDAAEQRAGASCDNLSLIVMKWAGDDSKPVPGQVCTESLALNEFGTAGPVHAD
jgi:serine/threonine protein phosphatase PrpC